MSDGESTDNENQNDWNHAGIDRLEGMRQGGDVTTGTTAHTSNTTARTNSAGGGIDPTVASAGINPGGQRLGRLTIVLDVAFKNTAPRIEKRFFLYN